MSTTTAFILASFAALLVWRAMRARPDPAAIANAREALARGARLIDVRSPAEFQSGHVQGARNLPLQSLSARISEVGPPDAEVVLCCASGSRSRSAAGILRRAGYQHVLDAGALRNLQGSASAGSAGSSAPGASGGLSRAERRAQQRLERSRPRRRAPGPRT